MNTINNDLQKGLTLIEIMAAMMIGAAAISIFMKTTNPTIKSNHSNKKFIEVTGGLSEILDSAMTQSVTNLDLMNGKTYTARQGAKGKLTVTSLTQGDADAIISGLDISKIRKVKVTSITDTTRTLSVIVSNYQLSTTGTCFTQ